jgi:hypothetical protein
MIWWGNIHGQCLAAAGRLALEAFKNFSNLGRGITNANKNEQNKLLYSDKMLNSISVRLHAECCLRVHAGVANNVHPQASEQGY